jgi:hypothetical protein
LGALLYVLWGLAHYKAVYGVYQLANSLAASMERGRLQQEAFYIAAFATTGIIVAALLNWRNNRFGFWLNAIAVGAGDIPFILFVLLPGYVPFWPGVLGPALWIAAMVCTALGQSSSLLVEKDDRSLSHRAGVGV